MATSDRRERLLSILENDKYVDVKTLVERLSASEATIRRDLDYLAQRDLLFRTHGGAYFVSGRSTANEPSIDRKHRLMVAEKRQIAQAAAELVSPGDTLILDSGSTTWHVGDQLQSRVPLTVVSNDLQILIHLASFPGFSLIDTGGVLRPGLNILLGANAVRAVRDLHVNWSFLGADAIDVEHGITTTNIEEVAVKQAVLEAGQRVVVVADHTKFGRSVFANVCKLTDVDMIITDSGLAHQLAEEVRSLGVQLILTP